jgi:hypothetical protein
MFAGRGGARAHVSVGYLFGVHVSLSAYAGVGRGDHAKDGVDARSTADVRRVIVRFVAALMT